MARPKKDNADYFSHDADMRNDLKIKALRRKYSHTGYAVYNYMLELLTDSDFFKHHWDELNIEIISGDFNIDPVELKDIIEYCSHTLKLFTIENELIWCNTLRKRFDSLLSKRKRDRSRVIAVEKPQSKVKESKVKEIKGENVKAKRFSPPTSNEIKNYCIERKNNIDHEKFHDFYSAKNWMIGKNKMKDWKAAVRTWERSSDKTSDRSNNIINAGEFDPKEKY